MKIRLTKWKIGTFALGLGWLIWGAFYYQFTDWDVGVSILMAGVTFLTADWCIDVLMRRQWRKLPLVIFFAWLAVDGVYVAWHTFAGNAMLRGDQWPTSLCLYLLCGFIWRLGE
ncbi:MAG: hypothetical protein JO142_15980 [Burkholderiales bacterium]|nr:hypothetical protein [Burkholderiales bacterium]